MCETVVAMYIVCHAGLPAYQLDLKAGDMIIEVDGTDVKRANGEMVANMIKWVIDVYYDTSMNGNTLLYYVTALTVLNVC